MNVGGTKIVFMYMHMHVLTNRLYSITSTLEEISSLMKVGGTKNKNIVSMYVLHNYNVGYTALHVL
jgi:hypothetical protein